ncbi:ubiquinol-cytochrome c reductase iron-sulfur subunit [Salarchaeum japonicum]|uniref:QcrA and Rieske domain-containing protein n=1 Tax=Salarchaeum japonicum TaxID=555573 RepID=UPI003C78DCF0
MSTNDDTTTADAEQEPEPEGEPEPEQPAERDTLVETRRNAAKLFAGIAGAAAIGSFAVNGLVGVDSAAAKDTSTLTYETMYVSGTHLVDQEGNRLGLDALPAGSGETMTVFPEAEGGGALTAAGQTATLLMRFEQGQYSEPTNLDGTVEGYAAYSKVCTHAGCQVSQRDGQDLLCPCHQSVFDPLNGCEVVGGPAPRPLPQLPIGVTEEGELLMATGHFEAPIGAGGGE